MGVKMKNTGTLILLASYLVVLVNCGKTEFSEATAGSVAATTTQNPPDVPTEFDPGPGPAPAAPAGPRQKVWSAADNLGDIGIYIPSAQKYGLTQAPTPGTACNAPDGVGYDLRSCAPNGQLCTSAGMPFADHLCCLQLKMYWCY